MKLYGIVGNGGFGREVMPLAEAMLKNTFTDNSYKLVFVVEQKSSDCMINQHDVLNVEEFFAEKCVSRFFNIAIAKSDIRKRIAELMIRNGAQPFRINAGNSIDLKNNEIAEGAIFCPFTIVTANAKIGKFFHANIYSYVAHDCIIGDYVTFAPNVHCNGNIVIEDHAYIGTGAIIREGSSVKPMIIGKGAIIGMGAVVTKSVAPYETVVGNPAHLLQRNNTIKEQTEL